MIKPTKQDLEFNETFKKWQNTKSKKDYEQMFFMVWQCCENLGKRLLKKNGIYGSRAENSADRWRDAATDSMRKLTDGKHNDILSLSAYCSNWVNYHMIHNISNIEADKMYMYGLYGDHDDYTGDTTYDPEFEY